MQNWKILIVWNRLKLPLVFLNLQVFLLMEWLTWLTLQFEEVLQVQILVLGERHNNKFIYTGTPVEGRKKVYLYMSDEKGIL